LPVLFVLIVHVVAFIPGIFFIELFLFWDGGSTSKFWIHHDIFTYFLRTSLLKLLFHLAELNFFS